MSQAEVIRTEPYMKYYSPDEIQTMSLRYVELLQAGKKHTQEAKTLLNEIPILPKPAQVMKDIMGIDNVIASGINLYEAVQEYGEQWLERK